MNSQKDLDIVSPKKIPGSPSLDAQFGGGRNPFNKSLDEADQEMKNKIAGGNKPVRYQRG